MGLGVGRGVLGGGGGGVTVPGVGVAGGNVTPDDGKGDNEPNGGEPDGNHGVIAAVGAGVGDGVGVGVSCSKICSREVGSGRPATLLFGVASAPGLINTARVPPANISPARSSTPTARIPGPRLVTRAVSLVR